MSVFLDFVKKWFEAKTEAIPPPTMTPADVERVAAEIRAEPHGRETIPLPDELTPEEAERIAAEIQAQLEKATGKKLTVVHLGKFQLVPPGKIECKCLACRIKAQAQWN